MTKSPWAKEVTIGAAPDPNGPAAGPEIGGVPGAMGGTRSYGGGDDGRRRGGARPNPVATVRWESAQPILETTKEKLPREFAGHYVIAVAGLPADWGLDRPKRGHRTSRAEDNNEDAVRVSDLVERLRAGAVLGAKGREPEGAGVVKRAPIEEAWLFGFSKEMLPLGPTDRDVEFRLTAGPMVVRAKFTPKDMMYQGRLAV